MNPTLNAELAEAARCQFRQLPEKHRLFLLKKAAPAFPRTAQKILTAAHIPSSFQIARIHAWLKADHQRQIEQVILATEHESWFQDFLREFFCNAYRTINDRFLTLIKAPGPTRLPFADALATIEREFTADPYVALFVATVRWVCLEAMPTPVDGQSDQEGQSKGMPESIDGARSPVRPDTDKEAPEVGERSEIDLTIFDTQLRRIAQALTSLQALLACDVAAVSAGAQQANTIIGELRARLAALSVEAGEPAGTWSNREEFINRWRTLSEAAEARRKHRRQASIVHDLANLFATVEVLHRLPSRRSALTTLARRASDELEQRALQFTTEFVDNLQTAQEWLTWAWSCSESEGEELRRRLQGISSAAAEFLAEVNWPDLRWSRPLASLPVEERSNPLPSTATSPPPARQVLEILANKDASQALESKTNEAPRQVAAIPTLGSAIKSPAESPVQSLTERVPPPPPETTPPLVSKADAEPSVEQLSAPVARKPAPFGQALVSREPAAVNLSTTVVSPEQVADPKPLAALPSQKVASSKPALEPMASSVTLANQLCATGEPPSVAAINELAWSLAREGRWSLCSCVLRAAEREQHAVLPAVAFELAALGPKTNYEVSPLSNLVTERLSGFDDTIQREQLAEPEQHTLSLLLAGALLRPALVATQTGAGSFLTHLALPGLPAFGRLVKAVGTFSLQGGSLRPELMQVTLDEDKRQQRIEETRTELRTWLERAPNYNFNFAPAGRLWRFWLKPGGKLHRLVESTLTPLTDKITEFANTLKPWQERPIVCIQDGMKEIGQTADLDGKARGKMAENLGEMTALLSRLLALHTAQPRQRQNHQAAAVAALRHLFEREAPAAEQELEQWATSHSDTGCRAVARLCQVTLVDARGLLAGKIPLPGHEPDPQMWLTAELFRDPRMAEGGMDSVPLDSLFRLVTKGAPDWGMAANNLMEAGDFGYADRLLNWLEEAAMLEKPEKLRQRWQQGLDATRAQILVEVQNVARELHHAVSHGLCGEKDYGDWNAEVDNVKIAVQEAVTFSPLRARLFRIKEVLFSRRQEQAEPLRQRLMRLVSVTKELRERVGRLLTQGDIHTAEDYLGRLEKGEALEEVAVEEGDFEAFFGEKGWLPTYEAQVTAWPQNELVSAISKRTPWAGLDFSRLLPEQIQPAEQEAKLWAGLERGRAANQDQVLELARFIGLEPMSTQSGVSMPSGRTPWQRWTVITQMVNRRSVCPVPQFGSDAGGRYELTLLWGSPAPKDIVQLCRSSGGDTGGSIVVTFSTLNAEARRTLERAARGERFRGLVLDRALFLFLLARPAERFATLLRCALPFSVVEPYVVDTSGRSLPPEMFFGRQRELDLLRDPRGSCFVFGGRQLGKTALLRMVEREFDAPDKGHVCVFVDLKAELLSQNRPMDDLWVLLGEKFKKAGVLEGGGVITTSKGLLDGIRRWLDGTVGRRVLLLLDEADFFLETDGNAHDRGAPFQRCDLFRGLMDQTERRFKVVFAGLHNVKRSTELANHPLAHFGEAICVGPLLTGADARAARELVEQPLATAGYFLESPDLANRVLALTNYYPSLIQIFGHHLLNDLREHHIARFPNWRAVPPCRITAQHVETAFSNRVRDAIRDKFALTLQLDARYKLIAYLLAYYHLVEPTTDGQDTPTLRRDAEQFWPAGFSDLRTDHQFRVLLEEMVGLGVLRAAGEGARFALRNRNVVLLLGTQEQIEGELHEAKHWEPALKYEADKFRQLLSAAEYRFSPLTAQQEGELKARENRVVVLFGTAAGGWADVPVVAKKLFDDAIERYSHYQTPEQFSTALEQMSGSRKQPHSLALVPPETDWDDRWLEAALQRVNSFTAQDKFSTILFLADPKRTWEVIASLSAPKFLGVRRLSLGPWHDAAVRQLLHERVFGDQPSMRQQILKATGNWPLLIQRLASAKTELQLSQSCEGMATVLQAQGERIKTRAAFGLDLLGLPSWLPMAAGLGRATAAELLDILRSEHPSITPEELRRVLLWAEALSLAHQQADIWEFDAIVAALIG